MSSIKIKGGILYKKMQIGGSISLNNKIGKEFTRNWLNSPITQEKYADNLREMSTGTTEKFENPLLKSNYLPSSLNRDKYQRKAQANLLSGVQNINKSKVRVLPQQQGPTAEYTPFNKTVNYYRENPTAGTATHEYTHVGSDIGKEKGIDRQLTEYVIDKFGFSRAIREKHPTAPTTREAVKKEFNVNGNLFLNDKMRNIEYKTQKGELYPRFMEMRQFLNVQPGQPIDDIMIDKLMNNKKTGSTARFYTKEKLKNILNTIAFNDAQSNMGNTRTAAAGGILYKKMQSGGPVVEPLVQEAAKDKIGNVNFNTPDLYQIPTPTPHMNPEPSAPSDFSNLQRLNKAIGGGVDFGKVMGFFGQLAEAESFGGKELTNPKSSAQGYFHFLIDNGGGYNKAGSKIYGGNYDSKGKIANSSFGSAKQRIRNLKDTAYAQAIDRDPQLKATLDKISSTNNINDLNPEEQAMLAYVSLKMKSNTFSDFLRDEETAENVYIKDWVTLSGKHTKKGINKNWRDAAIRRQPGGEAFNLVTRGTLDEALFGIKSYRLGGKPLPSPATEFINKIKEANRLV